MFTSNTPSFITRACLLLSLLMVFGHVNAQSITEQLEQGLGLKPPPSKTAEPKSKPKLQPAAKPTAKPSSIKPAQKPIALPMLDDDGKQTNLAEDIESLKQAMINLNRDLFILEEDLLFPSSTKVAVYLSMDVGEYFGLDAVELRVDGEVKTHYLYTSRQVNALYRGGVQRLFVDNVNQGDHELTAFFVGIGPQKRDYKRAVSLAFNKGEDPVAIELSVIDSMAKQQPIFEARQL